MKKVVLSIAAMITFACATHAQVSFIPKAGITISRVAIHDEESKKIQKSNMAALAGFGLNLPVSEDGFISVQPELLYIQKGFAYDYKKTEAGATATIKGKQVVNYFELPILAKVSFGGDAIKAYVNAGPSFGYALGGKYENKSTVSFLGITVSDETNGKIKFGEEPKNYSGDDSYISKDDANRMDVGVQFGGGIGLPVGPGSLLLDIRYGLGLSNFQKAPDPLPSGESKDDYKSQNRVIAISLGYAIPLGK